MYIWCALWTIVCCHQLKLKTPMWYARHRVSSKTASCKVPKGSQHVLVLAYMRIFLTGTSCAGRRRIRHANVVYIIKLNSATCVSCGVEKEAGLGKGWGWWLVVNGAVDIWHGTRLEWSSCHEMKATTPSALAFWRVLHIIKFPGPSSDKCALIGVSESLISWTI
jgi:hypothetical protein